MIWTATFWTATCVKLCRDGIEIGELETNLTGKGMSQRDADAIKFLIAACNEKEARERKD